MEKFEKNKWYSYEHGKEGNGNENKYYLKTKNYNDYCEYIHIDKNYHSLLTASFPVNHMYNTREATLEEIQQYLPDGHVDKIKTIKSSQYEVIHCKTLEEWEFVLSKLENPYNLTKKQFIDYKKDSGYGLNFTNSRLRHCNIEWYKEEGANIYSFEEWCTKFNHQYTPKTMEEEYTPKVGDWVMCVKPFSNTGNYLGEGGKLTHRGPYKVERVGTKSSKIVTKMSGINVTLNYTRFRKALDHEIPTNQTIEIGDTVRCIEPIKTSQEVRGVGWKKNLEFKVDKITKSLVSPYRSIYFPKEGSGVFGDYIELVKKKGDILSESYLSNFDELDNRVKELDLQRKKAHLIEPIPSLFVTDPFKPWALMSDSYHLGGLMGKKPKPTDNKNNYQNVKSVSFNKKTKIKKKLKLN